MAQEGFFKLIRDAQLEPVRIQIVANKGVLAYTTPDGFRPLEYAVVLVADKRGSSIDMVNLLLNQGAAPSDRMDPSGPTALHHAVGARELPVDMHKRLVELLLRYGADTTLTDYSGHTPAQMPDARPEVLESLRNAGSLRSAFLARGGAQAPPVGAADDWPRGVPPHEVAGGLVRAGSAGAAALGSAIQGGFAQVQNRIQGGFAGLPQREPEPPPPVVAAPPLARVGSDELPQRFKQRAGALAAGNDVHVGEFTLQQAYKKCLALDAAVGFTFAPTSMGRNGRVRCYFKSSPAGNSDPLWTTYMQQEPDVQPPPAPAPQPPAPTPGYPGPPAAPPGGPAVPEPQRAQPAEEDEEEAEDSDYNLRKLQRRHKGLQQTFRMLEQMGEDTTSVKVQRHPSFHIHSQGSDIQSQGWYVLL